MSRDLERYYSAIRGTELARQRGVDKAMEAEQAAGNKIREMTAAAEGDISSRSARIAQIKKWINSAQADGAEAGLPEPTETPQGVESFAPFRQALEKISLLQEQVSQWGMLEAGRSSEERALKRATVAGFASAGAGLLVLVLGKPLLAWLIFSIFAIGVAVLSGWQWYQAKPPAGMYTVFRAQRGEMVGMSFGASAALMFGVYVLSLIPIGVVDIVVFALSQLTGFEPEVSIEPVGPIHTAIGFIILAGAAFELMAFREPPSDDPEESRIHRAMILGLTTSGRALIVAGIVNYVLGLVAVITTIAPRGGYAISLISLVVLSLGLAFHATGQRIARKLSDFNRASMEEKPEKSQ